MSFAKLSWYFFPAYRQELKSMLINNDFLIIISTSAWKFAISFEDFLKMSMNDQQQQDWLGKTQILRKCLELTWPRLAISRAML